MKLRMKILGDIRKDLKKFDDRIASSTTSAMRETTDGLKTNIRGQISGAGLGQRLGNTVRSVVYPEAGKQSKDAAGVVFSKAPHILNAFEDGAVIRARNKKFLAIPTRFAPQYAGSGKGREQLTPQKFERITGIKLFFVPRGGGKNPLLVARGIRVTKKGSISKLTVRKATARRGERVNLGGQAEVPMFTLVPVVKLRKRIDTRRAFHEAAGKLAATIDRKLSR